MKNQCYYYYHLTAVFPGQPVRFLPFRSSSSLFWKGTLSQEPEVLFQDVEWVSLKTLRGTQSIVHNQWTGVVLSSSTAGLLVEGALLRLSSSLNTSATLWRTSSELKSHCLRVQMPVEGDDGSRIHKFLTDLEDESERIDWRSPRRDFHESIWARATQLGSAS